VLAASSDFLGSNSIVIEINSSRILYCSEGGDIENVARTSIKILCLCDWLAFDFSYSLLFTSLLICIYACCCYSYKIILFEFYTSRKQLGSQLLFKRNHEEKFRALHRVYGFISWLGIRHCLLLFMCSYIWEILLLIGFQFPHWLAHHLSPPSRWFQLVELVLLIFDLTTRSDPYIY